MLELHSFIYFLETPYEEGTILPLVYRWVIWELDR